MISTVTYITKSNLIESRDSCCTDIIHHHVVAEFFGNVTVHNMLNFCHTHVTTWISREIHVTIALQDISSQIYTGNNKVSRIKLCK